jgi:hypothetical protein
VSSRHWDAAEADGTTATADALDDDDGGDDVGDEGDAAAEPAGGGATGAIAALLPTGADGSMMAVADGADVEGGEVTTPVDSQ